MKQVMRWVIGGGIAFGLTSAGVAAEYFVATNGNDSAAGTNMVSAWRTIQKAADNAGTPGDIVSIMPGVYRETVVVEYDGIEGSPITFRANDGTNTVIIYDSEQFGAPGSAETYQWEQITSGEIDLPAGSLLDRCL